MRCVSLFTLAINHLTFSRGDLTAQPGGTPLKMAYDGEGKMSAACTNETGLCTDSPAVNHTLYRYDAMGQRVEKRTGDGTITRYLYDAGQLAAEYTNAPVTDSGRRYLTTDHLGTTRVITDPTGTILTRRDYFPFGEEISPATLATGNIRSTIPAYGDNTISSTTVRFTGKERDAETGLDYFGARYMSAVGGRFTSPDEAFADQNPDNPQTWNLYAYARNNPTGLVDIDGRAAICTPGLDVGCIPPPTLPKADPHLPPTEDPYIPIGPPSRPALGPAPSPISILGLILFFPDGASGTDASITGRLHEKLKRGEKLTPDEQELLEGLEPETAAGGAGARKGGGKTGRKSNEDRVASATNLLVALRAELAKLNSTPNKDSAVKDQIKRVQGQINKQIDRIRKSELHARQQQR